jgi:hypothetical protein
MYRRYDIRDLKKASAGYAKQVASNGRYLFVRGT